MKTPARYLVMASLLLAPLLAAEAGSTHYADKLHSAPTLHKVGHRTEKSRHTGKPSYRESRSLNHQQRNIRRLSRHFRADGYLSPRERRILSRQYLRLKQKRQHYRHHDSYRVRPGYWTRHHYRYDRHDHRPYGDSSGTIIFRW